MNLDQVLSAVRTVIGLVSGYAIGRCWIDGEQATLIGGLVVALVPFVWGWAAHTPEAKLAAAAALPTVQAIVTDPATAQAAPSAKVVPTRAAGL